MIITNVIILFTILGTMYVSSLAVKLDNILIIGAIFIVACVLISILVFAYGENAAEIADFNGISLGDYFKAIPGVLKDGTLFGLLVAAIVIVSFFAFDYYFVQMNSLLGIFFGGVILWCDVIAALTLQWFLPLRSILHNDFKKCLKKSFIIFFDNTGFSVLVAFYDLICVAFTVLFIGFLPGFAGILINNTNALRIRMYKYDYLDEHPELNNRKDRKHIPWEELIYDDREALGPRKLKSFLFPWKEEER